MSRQNHNANYIFDTDGETVWEKLRVIRNMLDDRKLALAISELNVEENESKDKTTFEYKKYLLYKPQQEKLIQECRDEIQFLEEFEEYLAKEAEKTRILGKTDEEMYEINFFEELKVRLVRRAQAQIISSGRIETETLSRILKNKEALQICIESNMLTSDVLNFTNVASMPKIGYNENNFLKLNQAQIGFAPITACSPTIKSQQ